MSSRSRSSPVPLVVMKPGLSPGSVFIEAGVGNWKSANEWHFEVLARWKQRRPAAAAA
jgi:hypothetical protein